MVRKHKVYVGFINHDYIKQKESCGGKFSFDNRTKATTTTTLKKTIHKTINKEHGDTGYLFLGIAQGRSADQGTSL